ncbi:ABC transporter substrate-binding protein [Sinomonas sp. ASV322]|uniref:ABC transporter substrate-binding protein n=1 Tax=Sinomonas sp. ASV322 TaxID=3041920 RepID=UPI0027DCCCB6|nr:ABC transporter substrate-binding protein [Sinomonas sp. ASV322]MDQ4503928.1 ABC transporter substrate-binding protein [Sinomonas sp. ASV322]
MSQSIDVGTVLGGRYKVTSSIVTSHDGDLVLDGVDQILNRPVSILVSAPDNAEQLAQSAREVAVGERNVGIQVLDLGVSHGATYLITNHAEAADLLDLIVAQEAPYVEPFFTDTLGSEIFGESRSREPETYNGLYDHGQHDYIQYPEGEEGGPTGQIPQANGSQAPRQQWAAPPVPPAAAPPPPAAPPRSANGLDAGSEGPAASQPKVTPWYEPATGEPSSQNTSPAPTQATPAAPAAPPPTEAPRYTPQPPAQKPASAASPSGQGRGTTFPNAARQAAWSNTSERVFDRDDELEEDDESTRPKSVPWLVGGILAVILIAALIFAFTTLGGLFQPQAGGTKGATTGGAGQSSSPGQSQPAAPVVPVIDSVTRLNPGELSFAAQFDSKLPLTFDGNPATYWSDMEFGSEDWGGLVKSVSLSVKLKEVSDIKQVELDQLGGTGGSVSVYTNAQPDLTGATLAGTSSFNSEKLVLPLPNAVKAQYVIIQIKALPRLSAPKTQYPYGLRLAEIKIQ